MHKVDLVIGVIGVAALIATGLGVAFYEDGATEYSVTEGSASLAGISSAVTASGHDFGWDAPDNSYGASFDVVITGDGAAPSGSVNVFIELVGPNPDVEPVTLTDTMASGATATFTISSMGWTDIPDDFSGDEAAKDAATTMWMRGITVHVVVDANSALPIPVPVQEGFTADVSGTAMVYQISSDIPDIEAA